jgi:hypothetical protein
MLHHAASCAETCADVKCVGPVVCAAAAVGGLGLAQLLDHTSLLCQHTRTVAQKLAGYCVLLCAGHQRIPDGAAAAASSTPAPRACESKVGAKFTL